MKSGVLIVDKPRDFTSFDVLASLRRPMNTKKLGHTGTLDPMATGVLPVLAEGATRASDLLPENGKAYRASFVLGITTDTQDTTGTVTLRRTVHTDREALEQACAPFRGTILQIPPMYSAVKKDGVRLYDLARRRITVEREARPVTIETLTLEAFDPGTGTGTLFVRCSKGTYIRTLIADLGEALSCGAAMSSLRRTEACGFCEADAISLQTLREMTADQIEPLLRPVESLFAAYPALRVTPAQTTRFANGGALAADRVALPRCTADGQLFRVFSAQELFLGLGAYQAEKQCLSIRRIFITNSGLSSAQASFPAKSS